MVGQSSPNFFETRFRARTAFLKGYLWWLFEHLLKNILRSFWYITETSSIVSSELNYFPQYLWKELYESWVSKYAKNNLVKMPSKIQREQLPCGKIKLIPKRSSFRVICVPIKRSLKLLNKNWNWTHWKRRKGNLKGTEKRFYCQWDKYYA